MSDSVTYTHGHHQAVLRSHRWRTVENSAAYLIPRLRPGLSLLDVGCGPGTITVDLAQRVAPGKVIGLDAEEGVLEEARETAKMAGLTNVEFRQGEAETLPFDDGTFDVTHAHQVLQHVGKPVAVLQEMGRVCRPGGVVAARDGDYAAFTWFPEDALLDRWLWLYREVARHNGGEPDAGRRLLSWAQHAGLEPVVPSASVWCYATPDEREWWADLWAERTTATAFGARAIELGLTDRAEIEAIAAAWRRWARARDGWFAVPHGEILAET
jgi:ubiquinone/menaquinone biosynthesis C-methylase UbiE